MIRLTSAAGMSFGATVMRARGTGITTEPITARSSMSVAPTGNGSIMNPVIRAVNIPLRTTAGIMLTCLWLRIMTKLAAMSIAVTRARRSPRTLPVERLPLKMTTIPEKPAITAIQVRRGTLSDRKTLVKIAAKSGVEATITSVLAAVVRRTDITKEMVLAPKKTPDTIPAGPMRRPSLNTLLPWANTRAVARVADVRRPLQKTRIQGSTLISDMRRASGLRISIADTMNRLPLVLSLMGVMVMVGSAFSFDEVFKRVSGRVGALYLFYTGIHLRDPVRSSSKQWLDPALQRTISGEDNPCPKESLFPGSPWRRKWRSQVL